MHYVEGKFWGGSTFRPIPEPNQSNMFEKKSTAVPESHTSMQSTISGSCNRAYFSIRVFHAFLRQMLDKFWVWSTLNCKRSDNMLFSTSQPQTSPNMDLSVQGVVELACIIFLLISSRTSWGEVRLVGPRMPRSHLDALRGDLNQTFQRLLDSPCARKSWFATVTSKHPTQQKRCGKLTQALPMMQI